MLSGHGRVHVHRGQGRVFEILQHRARQAARQSVVCVGRCRVDHDLEAQNGVRLRVHVQIAAHVPRHWREQGSQRDVQKAGRRVKQSAQR